MEKSPVRVWAYALKKIKTFTLKPLKRVWQIITFATMWLRVEFPVTFKFNTLFHLDTIPKKFSLSIPDQHIIDIYAFETTIMPNIYCT